MISRDDRMTAAEYRQRILGEAAPATPKKPRATPERDFQDAVIELAHTYGWRCAHFRAARTERGWRTPVQADGAGWPDLILCRRGRMIAAECKTERGRLSEDQDRWLMDLAECGAERMVWRPGDWNLIVEMLK